MDAAGSKNEPHIWPKIRQILPYNNELTHFAFVLLSNLCGKVNVVGGERRKQQRVARARAPNFLR